MMALQKVTGSNVEDSVAELGACGEVEVEEVEIAAASAIGGIPAVEICVSDAMSSSDVACVAIRSCWC